MKKRLAIYTAIYGDVDLLIDPELIPDNCDFFCFTDRKDISSKVVKVIYKEALFKDDANRSAKFFKLFPNEVLAEYEYSLWIDARTYISNPEIFKLSQDLLKDSNFVVFKHPERDSVYDEAQICIELGKDDPEIIKAQMQRYKDDNYKDQTELVNGGFILRRHNDPEVINFEKQWWEEILNYSRRDQLSFPYVAWKTQLKFDVIRENIYHNDLIKILRYPERDRFKSIYGAHNKKKIAIYSTLLDSDNFQEYDKPIRGCNFILITNKKDLALKNTEVRYIEFLTEELAQKIKLQPHLFLPEYEFSLYLDNSIKIKSDKLYVFITDTLKTTNFATQLNIYRDTLEREVHFSLDEHLGNSTTILQQYHSYLKEGLTIDKLIDSKVLMRKHMQKDIIAFDELWWQETTKWSKDDILSFSYLKWKTKLEITLLPELNSKNRYLAEVE